MSRSSIYCLAAALFAGGLTFYWRWPAPEPAPPAAVAPVVAAVEAPPAVPLTTAPAPAASRSTPVAARLPSLAGTEVDGRLQTDAAGNLVLELALRDYFD